MTARPPTQKTTDEPSRSMLAFDYKGINSLTLHAARVRVVGRLIHIPYLDHCGKLHNTRVIDPTSKRQWWQTSGLNLIPFGLELVPAVADDRGGRLLWICEGESDTLALRSEVSVWRDRQVDIIGLPGSGTWKDEWSPLLNRYNRVYVFTDADRAGNKMLQRITRANGRVIRPRLPDGEDVRHLVQTRGFDALAALITDAELTFLLTTAILISPTVSECQQWIRSAADAIEAGAW